MLTDTGTIATFGFMFGILVAVIVLVVILIKSKRNIEGSIKHGNSEASLKLSGGTATQSKLKEEAGEDKKILRGDIEYDLEKLKLHKFFTTVLVQYTTDNSIFNLYNETLRLNIIKDNEEMAQFKKLLATKYLNSCLFKVLGEHVQRWISDIVKEMEDSEDLSKVPNGFFEISKYITKYKNEAYKEGKSIEFKYNNRVFYGIPIQFMNRFNNWSDVNMARVYDMISDALYSTQNNWFAKTIELLDLFEVIFIMLHDQMDATLIILNGEIASFLKKLKEDPDNVNV
jgi:hypothetical protein